MIFFLFLIGFTALYMWRRSRRDVLAGRNSAKPVYSVEPPSRRVGKRSREAL